MPSDTNHRYDPVPPIPTYEEAVAVGGGTSRTAFDASSNSRHGGASYNAPAMEARSLLRTSHQRSSSTATDPDGGSASPVRSRRTNGGGSYRHPTVETDDEDSLWGDDDGDSLDGAAAGLAADDDEEAAHVRREMQELEMDDDSLASGRSRSSIFGKRIGFSPLSLLPTQWRRWKWRTWRVPLPRLRIQLPNANGTAAGGSSGGQESTPGDNRSSSQQEEGQGGGQSGSGGDDSSGRRWRMPKISGATMCLIIARLVGVMLVLGFLYLIFMSDVFASMTRRLFDPESVRVYVQSHVDADRIREHLRHFTSYAHVAGSEGDYALATDVKKMWEEYGLEGVVVEEYWTYINYPKEEGRAVEVLGADGKPTWSAKIEEEEVGGETAGRQTYVFHALSKAGDVKGPLIYANYGTREDFKRLQDMGIDTAGAIAIVRYYGPQEDPGLKVKAAEMAGFVGCIIYSDPADDGFRRGDPAPYGRTRPTDGAHRASVGLPGWVMGDPLTPGWESTKGQPVLDPPARSAGLVKIPSIPLAWRDAEPLLKALSGHGREVPPEWVGGVPGVVKWYTGDNKGASSSSPIVRLRNEQDEVSKKEIWNVYGRVQGYEQKAKAIVIGNRRDSLAFGAASPHSGTAVLMEMARIFGDLRTRGWQPMRSIDFMSWDGGEFNMAGSTEYVENNLDSLRRDALAYINLDEAVGSGGGGAATTFRAAGSPVFKRLLMQILHRVSDPNMNGTILRDLWEQRGGEIEGLGAVSDYVAFQDAAGTASLEIRFGPADGGAAAPPPPRGSSYENFAWMESYGDPGFVYHTMLGQILALLIVELADRPVMPFDMEAYAEGIKGWADDLAAWAGSVAEENSGGSGGGGGGAGQGILDVRPLQDAADFFGAAAKQFAEWEVNWETQVLASGNFESVMLGEQRAQYNARMGAFDSDLLDLEDGGGVPNRTQYKHVVFGPKLWASREAGYFPAVRDAVEARDWPLANQQLEKTVRILRNAISRLVE